MFPPIYIFIVFHVLSAVVSIISAYLCKIYNFLLAIHYIVCYALSVYKICRIHRKGEGKMLTLREWRNAKEISQSALAQALGVHVNTYSAWEKDPDKMPLGAAVRAAYILGVPFSDINFSAQKST